MVEMVSGVATIAINGLGRISPGGPEDPVMAGKARPIAPVAARRARRGRRHQRPPPRESRDDRRRPRRPPRTLEPRPFRSMTCRGRARRSPPRAGPVRHARGSGLSADRRQGVHGHADISTTMMYVHHVPQHDAAERLSAVLRAASSVESVAPEVSEPRPSSRAHRPKTAAWCPDDRGKLNPLRPSAVPSAPAAEGRHHVPSRTRLSASI